MTVGDESMDSANIANGDSTVGADGLPAQLTWPALPQGAVISIRRIDAAGKQSMFAVVMAAAEYWLKSAYTSSSGDWAQFTTGHPYGDAIAAAQSDTRFTLLRPGEISIYRVHLKEDQRFLIRDLVRVLLCEGHESAGPSGWPDEVNSFWSASDTDLEDKFNGFECTPRWVSINDQRVSCMRFEDIAPPDLIPVLFDEYGELDRWGEVGSASFREDDNMGRPFSWSGQMTLIRLCPGYAISLHEYDADVVAGPTYLMRLPLDSAAEATAIAKWQDDMDEATFANYQDPDADQDAK